MLRPAILVTASLTVAACAVNPATGRRQFSLITQGQEIGMGREYDPQIVASMGLYGGDEWQRYIQQLGIDLVDTARAGLPWTFRVVDDPLVNAFAVPGGFIYITRGILAHFSSEAQLAAVVGHEIGHVTARHSVSQMSTQTLLQGAVGIGSILAPDMQALFGVASAGIGVLSLKFSRDDETQSDELGLGYLVAAGYDPRPMPGVYAMLGRVSGAGGGEGPPEWLSSHPNPVNREQRITGLIAQLPNQNFDAGIVNADAYLRRLDGLTYGDNPREGFFEGNRFRHPDLAFEVTFPANWKFANRKSAVVGISSEENVLMQLTLSDATDARAAAEAFFADPSVAGTPSPFSSGGMTGYRGAFTATVETRPLPGYVTFAAYNGAIYQIVGYGTEAGWQTHGAAVQSSQESFRRLTDAAALNVQPNRIEIVTTDRRMSLQTFNVRYPSVVDLAEVALINQMEPSTLLPAGALVKRIVN